MMYKTIIFDLYGTLVPSFSKKDYEPVYTEMGKTLKVERGRFRSAFGRCYMERCRGRWSSIEENIIYILNEFSIVPNQEAIRKASLHREKYTEKSIQAHNDVINLLSDLHDNKYNLVLLTNCGPDVPTYWHKSNISSYFKATVFSCETGYAKPERAIYEIASRESNSRIEECLFVGDGSSNEIRGAIDAGMDAILLKVDKHDVYDPIDRSEPSDDYQCIESLEELRPILSLTSQLI